MGLMQTVTSGWDVSPPPLHPASVPSAPALNNAARVQFINAATLIPP
jgi:hypothetical protein